VDFGGYYVASIETALERNVRTQGRWARLGDVDLSPGSSTIRPVAGWQITLAPKSVVCPGVDTFHVLVDRLFPNSDPRVVVPSLKEDGSWPHVEDEGRLCLDSSNASADSGARVVYHIDRALDLLNFDRPTRRSEFQREFATYWRRGAQGKDSHTHLSLVEPAGRSREVWYAQRKDSESFVWADSKEPLNSWFKNAGDSLSSNAIRRGWAAWLLAPLEPSEFPKKGRDVLALARIPDDVLQRVARIGSRFPILIGAQTATGPVWVAAEIVASSSRNFQRRENRRKPATTVQSIRNRLGDLLVRRLPVERIDGAYVHGRDHNKDYKDLAGMRVVIVGCGSLGASVARLLAQAGVGRLALIDGDTLIAHNTSRHVLGQFYLGKKKARALGVLLKRDFPHQDSPVVFDSRFEQLTTAQLGQLVEYDLVVSAGIDYLGDVEISRWRREDLFSRPYHVSTWVEPFALAGHAVALLEDRDISAVVDDDGNSRYPLIHWKRTARIEWAEAGCGASFQPHGAVDLQRTVALAARLCLDVLVCKTDQSTRRVWLGDRDDVAALGGTPSALFDQSNTEKALPWPEDAPVVP
jgi:hypothetical protein